MSNELMSLIGNMFYEIAGSPGMVALILIFLVIFILLVAKVNKVVMLMVIVPFLYTITSIGISSYIAIPSSLVWINITVWLVMGIIMGMAYWVIT